MLKQVGCSIQAKPKHMECCTRIYSEIPSLYLVLSHKGYSAGISSVRVRTHKKQNLLLLYRYVKIGANWYIIVLRIRSNDPIVLRNPFQFS